MPATATSPKMLIIGGGIAGLCAAVYACRGGFDTTILEQHTATGGLATSWHRGGYTFETCLHWLVGSRPGGVLNAQWREVCDIDALRFINPEIFVTLETESGERLSIYTDTDRMEAELLRAAPEDDEAIRHFASAVRHLAELQLPEPGAPWPELMGDVLRILPEVPLLWSLAHVTAADYGLRFTHPLLRRFFTEGASGRLSILALAMSLAWMSQNNAGYAIGGAQALIQAIVRRIEDLGGKIRTETRVHRILVTNDMARGVELEDGEVLTADAVISAADGHATLYGMLGGRYRTEATDTAYEAFETFPSYLQVSLGVALDLSDLPASLNLVLDTPLHIDDRTGLSSLAVRIFHFDPTFAPAGKTTVTVHLPTENWSYWTTLRTEDPYRYQKEKHAIAKAVIERLDHRAPGLADAVEITDISTPASVVRYTGNWKGAMEGWLMTPHTGFGQLPHELPGLGRFAMCGHWVQPGGGLPAGLMTARTAVDALCREMSRPLIATAAA